MRTRIEKVIKEVEQLHAEAELEGLIIADSLWEILNDLYWLVKEVYEFDVP